MAKKPRTAAQIAATEKMLAARRANKEASTVQTPVVPTPEEAAIAPIPEVPVAELPAAAPQPTETDKDKMIIELQQEMIRLLQANQGATINKSAALDEMATLQGVRISAQGGVQGQVFKYPIDKGHYPDPTERLYDEPKLKRHALRENYYFRWDVTGETYEKHGITYSEPRFTVELYRHIFNDDGEHTNQLALVSRNYLHEDDFVATLVANQLGLMDKFDSKDAMMDEVRYHRIREWLLGLFTPAKFEQHNKKPTKMVIDGKVVEVIDSETIVGEEAAETKASTLKAV